MSALNLQLEYYFLVWLDVAQASRGKKLFTDDVSRAKDQTKRGSRHFIYPLLNISTLHIWIHEFYDHSQKSNIDGFTFHSSSWRSRAVRRRGWGCPSSPCGTSAPAPTCAPSPAPPPPPAAPCPACPAAPAQPIRCQHAIVLTNHSSPAPATSSPAPSWSACRHPASGGCSAAPPPAQSYINIM